MKTLEGFALGRLTQPLTFEIHSAGPQVGQYDPTPRYPDGTPVKKGFSTGSNRGRKPGGAIMAGHSVEAKAQMIERYKAGEGLQSLAAAYNAKVARVREILVQAGVDIRPFGQAKKTEQRSKEMPKPARELSAEDKHVICNRYQKGKSIKDLARQYHVGLPRIREVLSEGGVEIRQRGFNLTTATAAITPPAPVPARQMDEGSAATEDRLEMVVAAAPEPAPGTEAVTELARQRARALHQKAQMVLSVQELSLTRLLGRKPYQSPHILESGPALDVSNPQAAAQLLERLTARLNEVPGFQAYFEWRVEGSCGQPLAR